MTEQSRIPPLGEIGWMYAKYNWFQPLFKRPFLPTTLVVYVTYRCNARCVMCGIWSHQGLYNTTTELSLDELDRILDDRLFAGIKHLNINGGEPTLRDDLPDLIQTSVERLPRLQWISMSSNGLLAERLVPQIKRIRRICAQKGIRFSLAISMHGLAEIAEHVFGTSEAFDRQVQTLTTLQEAALDDGFRLSLHCVITKANLLNLRALLCWSQQQEIPISFALGEVRDRFLNQNAADQVRIPEKQKDSLVEFLRELSSNKSLSNPSAFRYHHLANMLQFDQRRTISCHYAIGGTILGSRGSLYYCPHSKSLGNCRDQSAYDVYYAGENLDYRKSVLIQEKCLHCPPYTFNRLECEKDLLKYFKFLITRERR